MIKDVLSFLHENRQIAQPLFEECFTVHEDGCWLWHKPYKGGYGVFVGILEGRRFGVTAHRASYLIYRDMIPNGLFVCHHCDVRHCVNPAHLYVGTHLDNMRDMRERGRAKGRVKPNAPPPITPLPSIPSYSVPPEVKEQDAPAPRLKKASSPVFSTGDGAFMCMNGHSLRQSQVYTDAGLLMCGECAKEQSGNRPRRRSIHKAA